MKINAYKPTSLSARQIEEIVKIGIEAFGEGMTRKEVLEHALGSDRLYLLEEESVMGFAGLSFRESIPYLSGVALARPARGAGHYTLLTIRRIEDALEQDHDIVATTTQNPRVESGLKKGLDALRQRGQFAVYEISRTFLPGNYGRMLTTERPLCRDAEINAQYERLDYERGDAFYLEAKLATGCRACPYSGW